MTGDPKQLEVENVMLRASLFLAARVLRDYRSARHREGEDGLLHLTVPPGVAERADDALNRADGLLQDKGRGR